MIVFLFLLSFYVNPFNAYKPPLYGPYNCSVELNVTINGFVSGGSQDAVLVYPIQYNNNKEYFPFLAFAHGMTVGGSQTYPNYAQLFNSVCSYGYIIVAPKSCPNDYCQNFYKDVITTIKTCSEKRETLNKQLQYATFDSVGVYGHSMGGAASVHVTDSAEELNISAAVGIHPSVDGDSDSSSETKNIKASILWFTGNLDAEVPAPTVYHYFNEDPIKPKLFSELKNIDHHNWRGIETPYVGTYFDCEIKKNQQSCKYFWGNYTDYNICQYGPKMTKCQVDES